VFYSSHNQLPLRQYKPDTKFYQKVGSFYMISQMNLQNVWRTMQLCTDSPLRKSLVERIDRSVFDWNLTSSQRLCILLPVVQHEKYSCHETT
jgi:hypothetical protein